MFRAAETVTRPGIGLMGGKGSVGIIFSRISVELKMLGRAVVAGNRVANKVVGAKVVVVR